MHILRWILTVAVVATFPVASKAAELAVQKQMMEPVVLLGRHCSGVIISSELTEGAVATQVLTAKHCVKGTDVVTLDMFDEESGALVSTLQQYYDVERSGPKDLALIKLRDTKTIYPTVSIANSIKLETGDETYVVGWPFGKYKMLTKGLYQSIVRDPYDKDDKEPDTFILASAPVAGGNSGGALFQKTPHGYEVIGITSMSAQRVGFPQMSLWVPLSDIQDFLKIEPKEEKATSELLADLLKRIECEEKAEDDEAKAKCSEPEE